MSNKYLPSDSWRYQQILYSEFNNELIKGLNQGLELYNHNSDMNLYKNTDLSKLDNLNFNNINNIIKENDIESSSFLKNVLGVNKKDIKTYIGLFIVFLLIYKKL